MSLADRTTGSEAAEWVGRLLVILQFAALAWMGWRASASPSGLGTLAPTLLAGSACVALWALAANRPGNFNIRPTPRRGGALVTTGPYRWIRHPMYTSVLLAAAGLAVQSHRLFDALLWLVLLAVLWAKALMEEQALRVRFPGYRDYMAGTTRFLPWLV